jgi:hypothetical protein
MAEGTQKPFGSFSFEAPSLEDMAREDLDELMYCLEESVEGVDPSRAFIDESFELEYYDGIKLVAALTRVVASDGRFDGEALSTGYRSFHFAHAVGGLLLSGPTGMKTEDFFRDVDDRDELRQKLSLATSDYYMMHPSLDIVTARFASELDPTGRYGDIADVLAGATFMFIEAAEKQKAIDREVAAFALQLHGDTGHS